MKRKIGRNEPCPCGSGKKYKKCCLNKLESQRQSQNSISKVPVKESVNSLREKIRVFMERGNFKSSFQSATKLFWNTIEEGLAPPEKMDENHISGLMEWFIHDYILPQYEKPLITVYFESNPELTKNELNILKDWQRTNISVFQIHRVEKGHGLYAEDIFTGEECFLHDVNIAKAAKQWELLVSRKVWVLDEWQLSAVGRILNPKEKKEIYDFIMSHYQDYQKEHPDSKINEFLHMKGYLLINYVLTKTVKPVQMPNVVTSDGEEILICEAVYDVLDFEQAVENLLKIPDYQMTSRTDNHEGQPEEYTFDWLERGKSSTPSSKKSGQKGITYQSFYTDGPGQESYRVLGNIIVYQERLKLSVLGKERFKIGKDFLEKHLKKSIKHRIDSLQALEARMREGRKGNIKEKLDPDLEKKLIKDLFDKHYKNWLESKIPALGNITPREASKIKKGQSKLEDLLRVLEYEVQRQKENGQIDYDVCWIREELGMITKD